MNSAAISNPADRETRMPTTYIIIDFTITGDLLDGAYQAGTKELIAGELGQFLDDGKQVAVLEITFDKGNVTEQRDVTNEVTEIAAAARLVDYFDTDALDGTDFPEWITDTDAYDAVPFGRYSAREAAADRWVKERMEARHD
jgi:hypothetical protein